MVILTPSRGVLLALLGHFRESGRCRHRNAIHLPKSIIWYTTDLTLERNESKVLFLFFVVVFVLSHELFWVSAVEKVSMQKLKIAVFLSMPSHLSIKLITPERKKICVIQALKDFSMNKKIKSPQSIEDVMWSSIVQRFSPQNF